MPEVTESKYLVNATWDDVPHLTEKAKRELWNSTPAHLRGPVSKGIPSIEEGAVYPVDEEDIKVDPFTVPLSWPLCYGMDVGWNWTTAIWGAWDLDNDIIYLVSEYARSEADPTVHASAIKQRGSWIHGVIDPSAGNRNSKDGEKLIENYRDLGLHLEKADNAVQAGLHQCLERFSTGRLKVFYTLTNFFREYRIYRRDKNGKIVKKFDHMMDATRYLVVSGYPHARCKPSGKEEIVRDYGVADSVTGY